MNVEVRDSKTSNTPKGSQCKDSDARVLVYNVTVSKYDSDVLSREFWSTGSTKFESVVDSDEAADKSRNGVHSKVLATEGSW